MGDDPNQSWKNKINWHSETNFFGELNRIDGKPVELEWKILPGFKTAAILKEIQNKVGELQCDRAVFKDNSRQMARTRKLQKFLEGPRYW